MSDPAEPPDLEQHEHLTDIHAYPQTQIPEHERIDPEVGWTTTTDPDGW